VQPVTSYVNGEKVTCSHSPSNVDISQARSATVRTAALTLIERLEVKLRVSLAIGTFVQGSNAAGVGKIGKLDVFRIGVGPRVVACSITGSGVAAGVGSTVRVAEIRDLPGVNSPNSYSGSRKSEHVELHVVKLGYGRAYESLVGRGMNVLLSSLFVQETWSLGLAADVITMGPTVPPGIFNLASKHHCGAAIMPSDYGRHDMTQVGATERHE